MLRVNQVIATGSYRKQLAVIVLKTAIEFCRY